MAWNESWLLPIRTLLVNRNMRSLRQHDFHSVFRRSYGDPGIGPPVDATRVHARCAFMNNATTEMPFAASGGVRQVADDKGVRARSKASLTERRSIRASNFIGLLLLCCTAAMVLSVPAFPSMDGPLHLYYADIVRNLLAATNLYGDYFQLKSLVTPYALQYFTLAALQMIFSPLMSEKVLICIYIVIFGVGFAYLVNAAAGRRTPWVLFGLPFCMHRLVYMGFLNYCIGLAVALFLCGYWIRWSTRMSRRSLAVLTGTYVVLMVIHPAPLVIFLLFAGMYTTTALVRNVITGSGTWVSAICENRVQFSMIVALGLLATLWLSFFVVRPHATPPDVGASVKKPAAVLWTQNAIDELKLYVVLPFSSPGYRSGPFLLVCIAALALAWACRRGPLRLPAAAIACAAFSLFCFTLHVVAPAYFNGGTYIGDRFAVAFVMFLIAAAAAAQPAVSGWRYAIPVVAVTVAVPVLYFQWQQTSAIAADLNWVLTAPPMPARSIGFIVGQRSDVQEHTGLMFDPYLVAGAHYFRRSHAIMGNALWMDLPHIMLRPTRSAPWHFVKPQHTAEYLLRARNTGATRPEITFLVRAGSQTALVNGLVTELGFTPAASCVRIQLYTVADAVSGMSSQTAVQSR
jgi:hypothetical protein